MKGTALKKRIAGAAVLVLSVVFLQSVCRAGEGDYYFREGTRLLKQAKLDQAVTSLTEAIRLAPDRVEAYNNRGLAYFEQKRYPEAKRDFFTALQLSPDNQAANNNLGIIFCGEEDYDQALSLFQKAAQGRGSSQFYNLIVYRNLSFVYARKGMTAEAAEAAGKAQDIQDKAAGSLDLRPYGENTADYALTLEFSTGHAKAKKE